MLCDDCRWVAMHRIGLYWLISFFWHLHLHPHLHWKFQKGTEGRLVGWLKNSFEIPLLPPFEGGKNILKNFNLDSFPLFCVLQCDRDAGMIKKPEPERRVSIQFPRPIHLLLPLLLLYQSSKKEGWGLISSSTMVMMYRFERASWSCVFHVRRVR